MIVIRNKTLRSLLKILIPFAAIPALVLLGLYAVEAEQYLLVSFGIAVLALVLFFTGFERKITGSRRMVIAAVMTALCVAGRFIPFFKPITALTVITAVYLGGECGFFVGALAACLSNFTFGQGPWTPFQMLAWGLIGLFAGYFSRYLKNSRALMCIYGVISGMVYSLIMDVWSVMWYSGGLNAELYFAAMMTAVPHTFLYAVSNFVFLWFLAKPFGDKLERVRIKYGV